MATKTEVVCDFCGEPIESDRHLLRAESGSMRARRPETDLHPACFASLLEWLEKGSEGFKLGAKQPR